MIECDICGKEVGERHVVLSFVDGNDAEVDHLCSDCMDWLSELLSSRYNEAHGDMSAVD